MGMIGFGILLAGILIIRKAAWKHISRMAQYTLWLFAAFFLLFSPFLQISSRFSLENLMYFMEGDKDINSMNLQEEDPVISAYQMDSPDSTDALASKQGIFLNYVDAAMSQQSDMSEQVHDSNDQPVEMTNNNSQKLREISQEVFQTYLPCIRWCGTILFLLIVLIRNIRFGAYCRQNRVFYRELMEEKLQVYHLKGIPSPFLFGKSIYVDASVTGDDKMLHHIILHEYCHFKHRDNFWAFIRILCLALNWYNPFVWVANDFVKRDCELACDESVLQILGEDQRTGYGYTLLHMVSPLSQKTAISPMATTMSNQGKKLKERILMIRNHSRPHKFTASVMVLCLLLLTGCTFTGADVSKEASVAPEKEEPQNDMTKPQEVKISFSAGIDILSDSESDSHKANHKDKYYNVSAKSEDGTCIYISSDGLCRTSGEDGVWERIYSNPVMLGTIAEGYLFFYYYPDSLETSGIMALNLASGEMTTALALGDEVYSYHEMYGENGNLYMTRTQEGMSQTVVFEIQDDGVLQEKGSLPVSIPKELADEETYLWQHSQVISMSEGYPGIFFAARSGESKDTDILYYCEDGNVINRIEGVTDVMITSKGIIGRDVNSYKDVYVWDAYTGEKRLLYSAAHQGGAFCGYNTYDEQGIYGLLYEDENWTAVVRIGWDGSLEKLFTVDTDDLLYGIGIQMSIIDNCIYYFDSESGEMEKHLIEV